MVASVEQSHCPITRTVKAPAPSCDPAFSASSTASASLCPARDTLAAAENRSFVAASKIFELGGGRT